MRLLTATLLTLLTAVPAIAKPADKTKVEAELKRMTNELLDAIAPGDVAVWKRYAHDRLLFVSENNLRLTRGQLLEEMQPLPKGLIGELEVGTFHAVLHGNVAVTTYVADVRLDYHGQLIEQQFRITDTG